MGLILLQDSEARPLPENALNLSKFCTEHDLSVTFEWLEGQYWLHSDLPKERPIGIQIDLILDRHLQYFKKSSVHNEQLARALGIKGGHRPHVLDLTAGLLGDSLLFLAMGCKVVAIERNPIVAFLIDSALACARHPLLKNFSFHHSQGEDSLNFAQEVIYFDPMFEDANDKASPRKEMRIFRNLLGGDMDALKVFQAARNKNPKRLVVKRPRLSVALAENALQYVGKATRYDVYLGQNKLK